MARHRLQSRLDRSLAAQPAGRAAGNQDAVVLRADDGRQGQRRAGRHPRRRQRKADRGAARLPDGARQRGRAARAKSSRTADAAAGGAPNKTALPQPHGKLIRPRRDSIRAAADRKRRMIMRERTVRNAWLVALGVIAAGARRRPWRTKAAPVTNGGSISGTVKCKGTRRRRQSDRGHQGQGSLRPARDQDRGVSSSAPTAASRTPWSPSPTSARASRWTARQPGARSEGLPVRPARAAVPRRQHGEDQQRRRHPAQHPHLQHQEPAGEHARSRSSRRPSRPKFEQPEVVKRHLRRPRLDAGLVRSSRTARTMR